MAKDIKFLVNNSPSFKKYKDKDDLSWVINENCLLTVEFFEYYSLKPKTSLTTIEGKFVDILRIFKIAYDTKNMHYTKK
jgi:hypothetical protein